MPIPNLSLSDLTAVFGDLPRSPVIHRAYDHVRERLEPFLFNHVARSWVFSVKLAARRGQALDAEVVAVSTLLHDLGLTPHAPGPHRFEVNGAEAARAFVRDLGFDDRRAQLVWDSIALHATPSIGFLKEPEVAICGRGITLDFGGPDFAAFAPKEIASIVSALPRLDMKQRFTGCMRHEAETRPEATYDNLVRDFGLRYVQGYAPPSWVDQVLGGPYDE
ncbi:MAG: HD domain-containing protein [Alphaproteobacteria bacterium]|nr:HD domain-containing protein [Alphaproteobacteria bacterium]MBU1516590.1 HD domain-containing protein [Alphaproteobacteria bacterium]MBU2094347.1 HD domain-containing protein [Alphaproteobacteria bacterium]MBU2153231.1 HD domain-containing protein [Alphaproteobacteria bacterium]MBU2307517.1 HD domain-containing protein [Alphaproteobacteria bacterium]